METKINKLLIYLIITISVISNTFAISSIAFTESNSILWSYSIKKITSTPNEKNLDITQPGYTISPTNSNPFTIPYPTGTETIFTFIYPKTNEDYTPYIYEHLLTTTGSSAHGFSLNKYQNSIMTPYDTLEQGQVCQAKNPTIELSSNNIILKTNSTLNPMLFNNFYQIQNTQQVIPNIMNKYYYMKAFAFLKLTKIEPADSMEYSEIFILPNSTNLYSENNLNKLYSYNLAQNDDVINQFLEQLEDTDPIPNTDFLIFNNNIYSSYENNFSAIKQNYNMTGIPAIEGQNLTYTPYILLKPEETQINFNIENLKQYIKTNMPNGAEWTYNIEAYIIPIDGKCDLDNINGLEPSEYQTITSAPEQITIANTDKQILDAIHDPTPFTFTQLDSNFYTLDDNQEINKIKYDNTTKTAEFIINTTTSQPILLPTIQPDKQIQIYKNGINIRNDTVSPANIALKAHTIKTFKTAEEAETFIDNSYNLMTSMNITKSLDNQTTLGKTKVKIKLQIPAANKVNVTLYQIIPKTIAQDISQINFINNAGAQLIILEKDPVIGWYFEETEGEEEIEYEIPGEGEGGTIIITQEPILFNEGELIINYRETDCNPDEAQLFELDSLIASPVYTSGSGKTYKVCVAHIKDVLDATINPVTMHILNYTNTSNMSLTQTLSQRVDISVQNSTPLYWDMKIQETNPNGNYSCLGSIDNEDNSLFGDCGYTTKRIWLHLGEDYTAPTTTLSYPYIAHTLKITLQAKDSLAGAGIKSTFYCIINETENCNNEATFTQYTAPFLVTCENKWGCYKEIKYYSTDNAENKEITKSEILKIIDKGSACQTDCTAKPSPNRYLKECRNLNGCKYYKYNNLGIVDDGEYVAQQCDYLIQNSWTKFNTTHEIKCPDGPFRRTIFSIEKLFYHNSLCDNIQVIPYTTYINGEQVKMNFIYCTNFN